MKPRSAEEQRLLEAVRAQPQDLSLRLILADWYEDRGDPRAELIQVQCLLQSEQSAAESDHRSRAELLEQERSLLHRYEPAWFGRPLGAYGARRPRFEFGAVAEFEIDAEQLVAQHEQLSDHAPLLSSLMIAGIDDSNWAQVLECPLLGQVGSVGMIQARMTLENWERWFAGLAKLRLHGFQVLKSRWGDEHAAVMAGSGFLQPLRELDLSDNAIGVDGLGSIAPAVQRENLTQLRLDSNPIGDDGAAVIAESAAFNALSELSLASTRLGVVGLQSLLNGFRTRRGECAIKRLNLAHNPLRELGGQVLANGVRSLRVNFLDGSYCELGDAAGGRLLEVALTERDWHLDLTGNRFSAALKRRLRRRFGLRVRL